MGISFPTSMLDFVKANVKNTTLFIYLRSFEDEFDKVSNNLPGIDRKIC